MSELTEYARPKPRYGLADAGWRPTSPWELVDGQYKRMWHNVRTHRRTVRRARIWRADGLWTWAVDVWVGRAWRTVYKQAGNRRLWTWQAAVPFADLAART